MVRRNVGAATDRTKSPRPAVRMVAKFIAPITGFDR
jgi:hypothetical protein